MNQSPELIVETQEPTPEPALTSEQQSTITLVSLTSPVQRNSDATIKISGTPGNDYSITVYYNSGASTAEGLNTKTADGNGDVTWTWHVGGRTAFGTYRIVIKNVSTRKQETFYFTIE